ncbi:hypothetical protein [Psychromonas algarum]|nr:hypothetical protein [Psychromonas sp. RZ22]
MKQPSIYQDSQHTDTIGFLSIKELMSAMAISIMSLICLVFCVL